MIAKEVFRFQSLACLLVLTSCATPGERSAMAGGGQGVQPAQSLAAEVAALSPSVRRREAQRVAECAYATSGRLAREYRVVGSALVQNFLVNAGLRERGLCYQWTEDLMRQLQELKLETLELHWAVARAGTLREHNSVVVTAKGQPFAQGIVLDPWRLGGRLYSGRVAADHYPWRKDESDYARARLMRVRGARNSQTGRGAAVSLRRAGDQAVGPDTAAEEVRSES